MTQDAEAPPPPLSRKRFELTWSNLSRALGLAWRVERGLTLRYALWSLSDGLLPVPIAWVGKQLVDQAVLASAAHGTGEAPRRALFWVGVELGLFLFKHVAGQLAGYYNLLLRTKLAIHLDLLLFEKVLSLSVRHFEDPEFMNRLERARKDASWRPVEMLSRGVNLARTGLKLLGFASLVAAFSPWAVLGLAVAVLPFFAEVRFSTERYEQKKRRTQDERTVGYLQSVLCGDWYAKEVRLFSLGRFLVERYSALQSRFYEEDESFARRRGRAVTLLGLLSTTLFYGLYAWVVARTVYGNTSLGTMTLYLTVFRQAQGDLQTVMWALAGTWEDNLYLRNLFDFLGTPEDDSQGRDLRTLAARAPKAPSVRFEGVSFQYPGSTRPALEGVSFTIDAGETVALVGPNGAGKTTLVKLLAGLYAPTKGKIFLDDEALDAMDRGELRARLGVVFQDFAQYHFTLGENIALGWLPALEDKPALERAAQESGADSVASALPKGLDTMLGRWFGGEQLSGGQWQRVALARAFLRPSDVLILDEPTAAIDAEGEHEVFQRFQQLRRDRTVVLITHRFSTVRMADRIVVVDGGKVVEVGTHAELRARGGLYARMFALQAEGYLEGSQEEPASTATATKDADAV